MLRRDFDEQLANVVAQLNFVDAVHFRLKLETRNIFQQHRNFSSQFVDHFEIVLSQFDVNIYQQVVFTKVRLLVLVSAESEQNRRVSVFLCCHMNFGGRTKDETKQTHHSWQVWHNCCLMKRHAIVFLRHSSSNEDFFGGIVGERIDQHVINRRRFDDNISAVHAADHFGT